jgi:hypothetical protein
MHLIILYDVESTIKLMGNQIQRHVKWFKSMLVS